MKLKILIIALSLLLNIPHAYAADLRGKLTGINGAQINVYCSGSKKPEEATISKTGSFNVTGLPANKSCYFTVTHGNASSVKMSFSSKKNVTVYNGSLKKLGKKILVIQQ